MLDEVVEHSLRQAALWDEVKDDLRTLAPAARHLRSASSSASASPARSPSPPKCFSLDEPASALDPISTAKIEDLIFRAQGPLYTIVIVTHNMQQAARVAENTGFFLDGQVSSSSIPPTRSSPTPATSGTEDYITGRFG